MPRIRIVSLLLIPLLLLGAFPAAADDDRDDGEDFLALGDSVAFGFSPLVRDPSEPENFVGYPEALAKLLDADVVNASCPGEASGGFISLTSPLDNGCRAFRFGTAQRRGVPPHPRAPAGPAHLPGGVLSDTPPAPPLLVGSVAYDPVCPPAH